MIALVLLGSTLIPLSSTMKPKYFPEVTPNTYFYGFNPSLDLRIRLKTILNVAMWPYYSQCFTIISSTYTSKMS